MGKKDDQPIAEQPSDLLTLAESAELLRLCESTLRAWRQQRRLLSFHKIGRRVFVKREDLVRFIEHSRQEVGR